MNIFIDDDTKKELNDLSNLTGPMKISTIKTSALKNTFFKTCPRCGSINVKNIFMISPAELSPAGAKKLKEKSSLKRRR